KQARCLHGPTAGETKKEQDHMRLHTLKGLGAGHVSVWDAMTGRKLLDFRAHSGGVSSVTFSPDAERLVSGSSVDRTLRLWNSRTGQEIFLIRAAEMRGMLFSPNGDWLALQQEEKEGSNEVSLWDVRPCREPLSLKAHEGTVFSVVF